MFNRIDRIVPFQPLDEETLRAIARRELSLLERREGIRYRAVHIEFAAAVAAEVVRQGYDVRYGHRPIKRAIDRHVAAPLAAALNQYSAETPLTASVTVRAEGIRVYVRAARDGQAPAPAAKQPWAVPAADCVAWRRDAVRLAQTAAVRDMGNEAYRLERWLENQARHPAVTASTAPTSTSRRRGSQGCETCSRARNG